MRLHRAAAALVTPLLVAAASPAIAADNAPAPAAMAPDSEVMSLSREIIATIVPADKRHEVFGGVMRAMVSQMKPSMTAKITDLGLKAIIDRRLDEMPDTFMPVLDKHIPDLLEGMALAYSHEFPLDELRQIAAFAKTPAGAHYLFRSSAILSDPAFAAANQRYMADITAQLPAYQDEIRKEVLDYLKKHPDCSGTKAFRVLDRRF